MHDAKLYLQRQDCLVDGEEGGHSLCPGGESGHIATHPLGCFDVVIGHVKVRLQQLNHFLINGVFRELLQGRGVELRRGRTEGFGENKAQIYVSQYSLRTNTNP